MDQKEQLFTIQQLSLKLRIPKPTLRYWEREFAGILVPMRTQGGQRRYNTENIAVIKDIQKLKNQGDTLAEIKRKFNQQQQLKEENFNSPGFDMLINRISEIVKAEVYNFFQEEDRKNKI